MASLDLLVLQKLEMSKTGTWPNMASLGLLFLWTSILLKVADSCPILQL